MVPAALGCITYIGKTFLGEVLLLSYNKFSFNLVQKAENHSEIMMMPFFAGFMVLWTR